MYRKQKGFSVPHLLFALVIIGLVSLIGWYVYQVRTRSAGAPNISSVTNTTSPSSLTASYFSGKKRFSMSTGIELFNDTDSNFNSQMQGIKEVGATWLRSGIAWQKTETSRGVYDWKFADRLVNTASSMNLNLIADVTEAPSWSKGTNNYGCSGQSNTDFALEDYAHFAQQLVMRYHTKVRVWEMGNEPNHAKGDWTHPNACQYTVMLKLTYQAIKAVDPTATVITGGVGGDQDKNNNGGLAGNNFIAALYDAGAKPYFDGVGYHPYSYPDSPKQQGARGWTQLLSAHDTMVKNGDSSKLIWITEYGAPANSGKNINGNSSFNGTEASQAQLLTDSYQVFSTYSWAGPLSWFEYRDHLSGPKVDKKLGLVTSTYAKRQSWYTYSGLVKNAQ